MSIPRFAAALALVGLAALPVPAAAQTPPQQREEIETIVRDYLLAHPEVIEQAIEVLRERQQQAQAATLLKAIEENKAQIFESAHQMVLGNPKGAITLVEFFDYNCGYCRQSVADLQALIDANPDLRVVMKEFPILSEGSVEAARISAAIKAEAPQSYWDFHQQLFTRPGQASSQKAIEVARDMGLDTDKLLKLANAEDVTANLKEVQALAGALGLSGTPSYVIGTELVPGAAGYDALQEKVTAMRQCGATRC
jgi:protein-disulfide isomerase